MYPTKDGVLPGRLAKLFRSDARIEDAEERLAGISDRGPVGLTGAVEVDRVVEVDAGPGRAEPRLVPIVTVPLATDRHPSLDAIFAYVTPVCRHLGEVYDATDLAHVDVRFELDDGSFVRSRTTRRVAIPAELVARLEDTAYDEARLREDAVVGDDGDEMSPPVVWGEPVAYGDPSPAALHSADPARGD